MYRFVFGFWLWIGVSTGYSQTGEELARLAETLEDSTRCDMLLAASPFLIHWEMCPQGTGVCTDVVIRAFRLIDIDLTTSGA